MNIQTHTNIQTYEYTNKRKTFDNLELLLTATLPLQMR